MKTNAIAAVAILLLLGTGCAASAAQIKQARTARYDCDQDTMFDLMAALLKEKMGGASPQRVAKQVTSEYRWHTSMGVPRRKGLAAVGPGDMAIAFSLSLKEGDGGWMVRSSVAVLSHVVGSPQGRRLSPNDADWPRWTADKEDALRVELHKRLTKICPTVTYAP